MSAQEVVRIQFLFDSDVGRLSAQLKDAQKSAALLEMQMAKLGKVGQAGLEGMHNQFASTLKQSGQWEVSQLQSTNATRLWGQQLAAQKLSLRAATAEMMKYGRAGTMVARVAEENVRMRQSFAMQTSPGPGGRTMTTFAAPIEADLKSLEGRMAYSQEKFKAWNASVKNMSTSLVNLGKNTQWAGRQMMVGMTLPVMALGVAAGVTFKKVDQELVRITKVYGDTLGGKGVNVEEVRANAMKLGSEIASAFGVSIEETLALTADLAAVGYTGEKLQKSVMETTRLALLGEVDRQAAMKTTLSLQTAFSLNTKEMTEAINFLNAAENATSTSLSDMTEAIPRAGTVVKALGGDVEDLTLYITAMREGGINAAEGANAIKSGLSSIITPAKEASNYVKSFGIDLDAIVNAGNGDLTATLMLFQTQLQKLDKLSQQRVISKLFGKFQMGRMTALFENLGKKGSQTNTIIKLMGYSAKKMAKMADVELSRTAESASGKFNRAWQSLRVGLAEMGEGFLKLATTIMGWVDSTVKAFNNLSDTTKEWISKIVMIAAATGPLVMISGILQNWVGHMVNFARLAMVGMAKLGGRSAEFKMLTPEDSAKKLGATIQTGFYQAEAATASLSKAIASLTANLGTLQTQAVSLATGGTLATGAIGKWSDIPKERLYSPGMGLETKAYNRQLSNKDIRPGYTQMIMGTHPDLGKVASQETMVQRIATERTMASYADQGFSQEQRKFLVARTQEMENLTNQIKAGTATSATYTKLKQLTLSVFPDFDQRMTQHITDVQSDIRQAAAIKDPALRQTAAEKIANQAAVDSSRVSMALYGTKRGGRDITSAMPAASYFGASTRVLHSTPGVDSAGVPINTVSAPTIKDLANQTVNHPTAPTAMPDLEGGHFSPDALAKGILGGQAATLETELEYQKGILMNQTAAMKDRLAALAKLAAVDMENAATGGKMSQAQISAKKRVVISNDEYLKANLGSVQNIKAFEAETNRMAKEQIAQGKVVAKATAANNQVKNMIAVVTDQELAVEQQTLTEEKKQLMASQKAARKATISRAVGAAGMIGSMVPMVSGQFGAIGDQIAPIAMGASMGAMTGNPWAALGGGAAMGGLQLFKYLQDQAQDAAESMRMSSVSAEIFGHKLKTIADANVDEFLKAMTGNAEAADDAAAAMQKFAEAIRNAPEGSPEKATVDRLKDLGGDNSPMESFMNFMTKVKGLTDPFKDNPSFGTAMGMQNAYDTNPAAQANAILKQRYADSLIGGATKEEALGEIAAYAKETGLTYSLKSINEELKGIKSNESALTVLGNQVKALAADGKDVKEVFRDIFNPDIIAQLGTEDLPAVKRALDSAGMSWDDYVESLRNGDASQKAFAADIDQTAQTLRVDASSAIQIIIAKLNGLDVASANFAGKTSAEVMAIISGLQQQADLTSGVQKKLDAYNKKHGQKKLSQSAQEDASQAAQDAIDAAQEQSDAEIKAMEETAKKREEAMQKAIDDTQKEYDAKIKAIQKENQAKQDAFDEEQQRIQRAKDARASEIEYLRAMSEGRYYDAAAIQNEMEATRQQNQVEDAQKAKNDKAEGKIEVLTEERDKKVESLNKQLKKQQEHDQKMLEQKREHDQKMLEQMQKTEEARQKAVTDTNKKIDKSNKKTAVTMEQLVAEIFAAAQKGEGALNKVLAKYHITQEQAMNSLIEKAGISGTDAAKILGKNLSGADWKSLAKSIEAELDNDRNAGKYMEAFMLSLDKQAPASDAVTYPGTKKPALKAYGGYISGPGTARSDSIPARLSNGEYVVNARSVAKVGVSNLNKINQEGRLPGYADGGPVPDGRGIAQSVTRIAMWDYIHSLVNKRVDAANKAIEDGNMSRADYLKYQKDIGAMARVVPVMTVNNGRTYTGGGTHSVGWSGTPNWGVNDIGTSGMEVRAYANGKVVHAGPFSNGSYSPGSTVDIKHANGGQTRYAHLQSFRVKDGDLVSAGEKLGTSGSDHLHFEWTGMPSLTQRDAGGKVPWLKKGGLIKKVKEGYNGSVISLPGVGVISGYTNTQLSEWVDIFSTLAEKKAQADASTSTSSTDVAKMKGRSPEMAKAFAKAFMLNKYNWGAAEFSALVKLWNKESGWKWYADNPSSDAYGIPQSLPGNKMASMGKDWKTNPETQIKWGLAYIKDRYKNPLSAWEHSQKSNWYKDGGLVIPGLRKGATINYDNTLANLHRGESVLTAPLTNQLKEGVGVASGGDIIYNVDITVKENMSAKEAENLVFHALDRHTVKVGRR